MSTQFSSNNPTSYMGVQPTNPGNIWYRTRDPLPSDFRAYNIGDRWDNMAGLKIWTMVNRSATQGYWVLDGGSAVTESLTPDSGLPVIPVAGTIAISGDATHGVSTYNAGISTLGITVADGTTATPGVLELATNAQAIAGVDSANAVPSSALSAKLGPQTANSVVLCEGSSLAFSSVGPGTATYPLVSNGIGNDPTFSQLNLASGATGVLPIANGGTGVNQIPSFSAYLSVTQNNVSGSGTYYSFICDTADFNVGAGYNTATGIFTAPIAGKYLFETRVHVTNCTIASAVQVKLTATAKTVAFTMNRAPSIYDLNVELTQVISMSQGDTCYPSFESSGEAADTDSLAASSTNYTGFCGCWVGP